MTKGYSATDLVLLILEKSVDGLVRLEDFTYNSHIYACGYDRPLKKSALAKALSRLRQKGYIEKEKDEQIIIYKLTEVGKYQARIRQVLKEDVWDNKWRVVVFDVPENKRRVRNALRSRLKLWEFKQLQKSVWVGKKNVTVILKKFIKEIGIADWVLVFETNSID